MSGSGSSALGRVNRHRGCYSARPRWDWRVSQARAWEIGCGERASIPTDRVDDKIRRQMNLLLEVPEEQMAGWPRLTRATRRRRANRKDLRLPRFHITYKRPLRSSAKSSLLWPVRLGQSTQAPAAGYKLASVFENGASFRMSKDVLLNPLLQMANGEQDALGLALAAVPILAEASGEGLLLLGGLQLRE